MMMMYNNDGGQTMSEPPVGGTYGHDFSWAWNGATTLVVSTSVSNTTPTINATGGNETRPIKPALPCPHQVQIGGLMDIHHIILKPNSTLGRQAARLDPVATERTGSPFIVSRPRNHHHAPQKAPDGKVNVFKDGGWVHIPGHRHWEREGYRK
jgi:hypothetical protein